MSESPDTQAEAVCGPCEACGCEIGTDGNCVWCAGDYPPHTHDPATPSAEPDGEACAQCGPGYRIGSDGCKHTAPAQDGAEDSLAAEIRRVTGTHVLYADAWAEALMPWLAQRDKDRDAAVAAKVREQIAQAIEAVLADHVRSEASNKPFVCSCDPHTSDGTMTHTEHVAAALRAEGGS